MSLRRTLRILEGGLLASLAVVHLSFWLQYPALATAWPAFAGLIHDAALSAQAILIAGWFVAGPGKWWLRWPAATLLAAALSWFDIIDHPRGLRWGETVLVVQACSAGFGVLVMRVFGWRMNPVENLGAERPTSEQHSNTPG